MRPKALWPRPERFLASFSVHMRRYVSPCENPFSIWICTKTNKKWAEMHSKLSEKRFQAFWAYISGPHMWPHVCVSLRIMRAHSPRRPKVRVGTYSRWRSVRIMRAQPCAHFKGGLRSKPPGVHMRTCRHIHMHTYMWEMYRFEKKLLHHFWARSVLRQIGPAKIHFAPFWIHRYCTLIWPKNDCGLSHSVYWPIFCQFLVTSCTPAQLHIQVHTLACGSFSGCVGLHMYAILPRNGSK